jgi:hypothetical protein
MPIKSFTGHLQEAFTRQHYQAVANVIKKARHMHTSSDATAALNMVVTEMADMFAADNPNFRKDQFINATK